MASTTQDLAFDALGAEGYTGDLTERLMNWRTVEGLTSWETYRDYIITNGGVGSNFMDAQYAFWLAGLTSWSPLDLSPALWVDPSDASSVTISGSSGAYIGPNGLVLPGSGINYASSVDAAVLTPATTLEILTRATAPDYTPTAHSSFCSKRGATASNFGYQFRINLAGTLSFVWGNSSTTVSTDTSTVANGCTDGTPYWFRVLKDFSTGTVDFYYAADSSSVPSSWTAIGTQVAGSTGTPYNDTNVLAIGTGLTAGSPAEQWTGTIARTIVKCDGTTVFDADFEAATPYVSAFTESALGAPVYVVSTTAASSTASYAYVGPTGLVCSGSGANRAETPDSAALDITGDIDIAVRVRLPYASPASSATFVDKYQTAGNRSYSFSMVASGGQLILEWSTNGTDVPYFYSGTGSGLTAGTAYWLRATLDVDDGAAGHVVTFYKAADSETVPSSWTTISTQTGVGTTSIFAGTLPLQIGSRSASNVSTGAIMRAIVKNGIGGTTVFDADFTTAADYAATFTESSTNAATVTITATNTPANAAGALVSQINDLSGNARNLTQATAANMPKYWNGRNGYNCLVFDGASDRMKTASAIANAAPFAALAVVELGASPGANIYVWDSHTTSADVVMSTLTTTSVRIFAGTNLSAVQAVVGRRDIWAAEFNGASSTLRVNGAQVAAGNAGTNVHELVTLGSMADGTANWWKGTIGEVIFWPSPSSFTDVDSYASTKWGTP